MCHYKHLTLLEREKIMYFFALGYSLTQIAHELGRHKSTISRELKRNHQSNQYLPVQAQQMYHKRRKQCKPHKRLDDPKLFEWVKDKFLNHQWSPEEIAGRLKLERKEVVISYPTIYRGIYEGLFDEKGLSRGNRGAIRKLRHRGKKRHTKDYEERRGKIQISHDMEERPVSATKRSRFGHWEADTVIGSPGKACLVTLVDRKSRYLLGGNSTKKSSEEVSKVIIRSLKGQKLRSITPDRGKEFSKHKEITDQLNQVQFYFPKPHQPWQRGSNENTNGLLREYFPKGKDITNIPETYIQEKFDELNRRPRKCLNYKTPFEVYHSVVLHLT